jgi:hypothetical protein
VALGLVVENLVPEVVEVAELIVPREAWVGIIYRTRIQYGMVVNMYGDIMQEQMGNIVARTMVVVVVELEVLDTQI